MTNMTNSTRPMDVTKPPQTKAGKKNPDETVLLCGWCGHGLLGTIKSDKNIPIWRPSQDKCSVWNLDLRDNVWRVSFKASDIFGRGGGKRGRFSSLVSPEDWATHDGGCQSELELFYNNNPLMDIPLSRIKPRTIECPRRDCHRLTLIDLQIWAVEYNF